MTTRAAWLMVGAALGALGGGVAPAGAQEPRCNAATERLVTSAWRAYRADSAAVALARFTEALRGCAGNVDAQVGVGFASMRLSRLDDAEAAFLAVSRSTPGYADAWDGLALVRNRRGDVPGAVEAWKRVVALDPSHRAARENLDRLAPDWQRADVQLVKRRSETLDVTMRVRGRTFELRRGDTWTPFYIRGVNMGLALPGRFPVEFSTDSSLYARWLGQIGAMHANTLRIYTVLPPAFYRALRAYNLAHRDAPLHVIHGVWTELPPHDDFDDPDFNRGFQQEIRDVIDLLHGAARIAPKPGHASGTYDADISPWVVGYILGREWEPYSAIDFNEKVGTTRRHAGRFITIGDATPLDVWMVAQCDYLMAYEFDTYNAQRPIAYTNWPTTDPIVHKWEVSFEQQMRFRGIKYERSPDAPPIHEEEGVALDPSLAKPTAANVAGWFASYHVYPYYPDFMLYDPKYLTGRSSLGASNYFAYLQDLIAHHADIPVLISEFGLPSSRGNAHLQPQGWHHGGLDEREAAASIVRLEREIKESGAAGAIVFAWIDEWFKRNWFTSDFEFPSERGRLWLNMMSPEQHYGLLALRPGAANRTPEPGGDAARWRAHAVYQRGNLLGRDPSIVRLGSDEAFVYLSIETPSRAGRPFPWDSLTLQLAIDTHRQDLGQGVLPTTAIRSGTQFEFLVEIRGPNDAQLSVVPEYNLYTPHRLLQGGETFGIPFRGAIRSVSRLDAVFDTLYALTNRPRFTPDGELIPPQGLNVGRLLHGTAAEHSNADWYYDARSGMLQLRLPWSLLNVSDPSSRRIVWERPAGATGEESMLGGVTNVIGIPTDGFRIGLAAFRRGPRIVGTIPALDEYGNWPAASFPLWTWDTWEEPTWHERLKPAYYELQREWGRR